ncbi:MAG: TraR/DksA C4-type zinc finger protein [Dehalococcoidia bacterium]|nr:TraR/DksA C4-type zinc finger protein [Dehalococcoidia bacterium]MDW8120260.1 TraR/DksA C4-type zinc finger protein [Chloroflexota bacterium]
MPRKRILAPKTLMALRTALEQEQARLRTTLERVQRDLQAMAEAHGEENGYGTHLADVSSETHQQEVLLAERQSLETALVQVQEALERMDAGTYGYCVDCGEPIPLARLRAMPTALRDIQCQRAYESKAQVSPAPSPLGRFPKPLVTPEPEGRPTTPSEEK